MEENTKKSLKIIFDLYKDEKISEKDAFILLENIMVVTEKNNTTYFPINVPYDPKPDYPWERKIWYDLKPYCKEFYTTNTTNDFTHKKEDDNTSDCKGNFNNI